MPNAPKPLIALLVLAALAGCQKRQPDVDANVVAADNGAADTNAAGQTSFDTLPADESSTTPSNQLVNGLDNPDVNDVGSTNSD
jgi:hypothetical protein